MSEEDKEKFKKNLKSCCNIKNNFIFIYSIAQNKCEEIIFGDIYVKKYAFHKSKYSIGINEKIISKIVITNNIQYDKKRFQILHWIQNG